MPPDTMSRSESLRSWPFSVSLASRPCDFLFPTTE